MLDSLKKALASAHEELDAAVAKAEAAETEVRSEAVQAVHDVISAAEAAIEDALAKLHLPKGTKKAS